MEYYEKPPLPPPFIILYPLVKLGKCIFLFIKHRSEKKADASDLSVSDVIRDKKRQTNTVGLRFVSDLTIINSLYLLSGLVKFGFLLCMKSIEMNRFWKIMESIM